jgi:hypothetical protein
MKLTKPHVIDYNLSSEITEQVGLTPTTSPFPHRMEKNIFHISGQASLMLSDGTIASLVMSLDLERLYKQSELPMHQMLDAFLSYAQRVSDLIGDEKSMNGPPSTE